MVVVVRLFFLFLALDAKVAFNEAISESNFSVVRSSKLSMGLIACFFCFDFVCVDFFLLFLGFSGAGGSVCW